MHSPPGSRCVQPRAMLHKTKRPYDPQELAPRTKLRRNIVDIVANNSLSRARIAEVARDVNAVDPASFFDIARLSAKSSANNTARDVRRKFVKGVAWMPVYWAQVRCRNVKKEAEELQWIAISLPHEILHAIQNISVLEKLHETEGMDPLTKAHHQSCEQQAGCRLLGLGLWADGTPCNWDRSETVETLCLNFPGLTGDYKNLRITVTALSHKNVCANTWTDINAIVKWSLQILATGQWPTCRHDGSDWLKSDCKRVKAREIQKSCLVEVRADWDWMAKIYGFPAHNFATGCCWKCTCTPAQVMGGPRSKQYRIKSSFAGGYIYIYIYIYMCFM